MATLAVTVAVSTVFTELTSLRWKHCAHSDADEQVRIKQVNAPRSPRKVSVVEVPRVIESYDVILCETSVCV